MTNHSDMEISASPYLSPPTELLAYKEECVATTIDPSKLTTTTELSDSSIINPLEDANSPAAQAHMAIKLEQDDDYGFSKFAAERDAARDEMTLDEDTRLLMSEEGKKLSSKERRQLRNKVSARNFRERRKEYITHLESLVSKHQNEASKFQAQAEALKVEKDELASELSRLKISISAALESNKLSLQQSLNSAGPSAVTRPISRDSTPTRELSLIPSLTKDINPYLASANFNIDWPLSSMASPSNGSFDFNLHNYTSVFTARPTMPTPTFSEKELLGKQAAGDVDDSTSASDCLSTFDKVLSTILGSNWNLTFDPSLHKDDSDIKA